jgi:predicted transcriptional regulator
MPDKLKRGRLGKAETNFIRDRAGKTPIAEIAAELNRDAGTVRTWIQENMAIDIGASGEAVPIEENEIRNELRSSPEWEELKQQFVESELKSFERQYSKLMSQFRNDVMPTEEMQIFHLIKLNILMDRNLKSRARALQDIDRLSDEVNHMIENNPRNKPMSEKDRDRLTNLENQLVAAREAEQSKTGEYVKLSEKHSALMKELKATRDQRITKWENSKETFLGLLKDLQNEESRRQEGEDMELLRLAMAKEKVRLSQGHKYVDDSVDTPLLTPENQEE